MSDPGPGTSLQKLNSLSREDAVNELLQCCGSRRWAEEVAGQRPFQTIETLCKTADDAWWALQADDWLEAFHAHPRIGETKAATAGSAQAQQWSRQEQASVGSGAQETAATLAKLNREYDEKFGHIFIVCASGKSAEEMLTILVQRLKNEPVAELRIAAGEQAKITQLRLRKLLG